MLAQIFEAVEAFAAGWLRVGREALDVQLEQLGEVLAVACPRAPEVDFLNRPLFLRDPAELPGVLRWYERRGVRPWFETPERSPLNAALEEHGFGPTGAMAVLAGPAAAVAPVSDPPVRRATSAEAAPLIVAGHEVPEEEAERARAAQALWDRIPGVTCFVAGDGLGAGALLVRGELGYLANSATVPGCRRRGAQSALIASRAAAARDAGCTTVAALCLPGSASERNLRRAGLLPLDPLAVWR